MVKDFQKNFHFYKSMILMRHKIFQVNFWLIEFIESNFLFSMVCFSFDLFFFFFYWKFASFLWKSYLCLHFGLNHKRMSMKKIYNNMNIGSNVNIWFKILNNYRFTFFFLYLFNIHALNTSETSVYMYIKFPKSKIIP